MTDARRLVDKLWSYCDVLRARYPRIKVRKERALVVSGDGQRLVMAGGGTSWQDVALYLIARFIDVDAAMHVARINLIDWHSIGQQPFARLAKCRQTDDAVIARCQGWIAEHYAAVVPPPVTASQRSEARQRRRGPRLDEWTAAPGQRCERRAPRLASGRSREPAGARCGPSRESWRRVGGRAQFCRCR